MDGISRTSKTIKNIKVNLFFCLVMFFIAFFSRKVFLNKLGADFLGLISTIQGLIGFLNLMECGVMDSICFSLYKPLADDNRGEINEIISFLRILYRRIGYCILFGGIVLAFFLPHVFRKTSFSFGIIYLAYFATLIPTLLNYFINYHAVLFNADQKKYVVSGYLQTLNSIQLLLQLFFAYFISSFVIYITISLLTNIAYAIILNWKMHQHYPWRKNVQASYKVLSSKYTEIKKKIVQICIHKVCAFVQGQLTPVLIFAYAALKDVAYYENYMNVVMKIFVVIDAVLGSTYASVGNLLASTGKEKSMMIFQQLFTLRMAIMGFVCFMFYGLLNPFIGLWLGTKYVMPQWMLWFILIHSYFSLSRGAVDQFLDGMGMYSDFYVSIIEAIMFLTGALFLGGRYGFPGILFSRVFSQIITLFLWKPFFLFSRGFHRSVLLYWRLWFKNAAAILFCGVCCAELLRLFLLDSWLNLILYAFLSATCYLLILALLLYYWLPGGRDVIVRICKVVFQRFELRSN